MATVSVRPLVAVLAEVPDPRQARGRRHPLPAILALACVAMLGGHDSLLAIAEWGRHQGTELATRLGFTRARTPCVATLHRVFRRLDAAQFERLVGHWAEQVCTALGQPRRLHGLAIDGKTLRGSNSPTVPAVHLLSALSQELGVVLAQVPVAETTNEIPTLQTLLADLVLEGRIVTVDALLAQREGATTIRQKGGTT